MHQLLQHQVLLDASAVLLQEHLAVTRVIAVQVADNHHLVGRDQQLRPTPAGPALVRNSSAVVFNRGRAFLGRASRCGDSEWVIKADTGIILQTSLQ